MIDWQTIPLGQGVDALRCELGFDFCAIGLAAELSAPLKWEYTSGQAGQSRERIVLAPGRGIGGIVLKTGRPMLFTDIDSQLDAREYASYPIVFAENIRSFCALPLMRGPEVRGVLLCAFRVPPSNQEVVYLRLFAQMGKGFCGFAVVYEPLIDVLARSAEERFAKPIVGDVFDDESPVALATDSLADPYKELSNRELEVFGLLARGFTNREIANRLFVSVKTVETYRSNIYNKLHIESRAELVALAIRHQLLGV